MDETKLTANETIIEAAGTTSAEADGKGKVLTTADKTEAWEHNHYRIAEAMSAFMRTHERMPAKTELAKITGLCRLTIHRHLQHYDTIPMVKQQEGELRVLYTKLLSRLYTFAMNGDVRAAKLYIDTVERLKGEKP